MKKISINRCARSGGGGKGLSRDRIDDVRFSSYSLQAGRGEKKWKLITSSLTPEPEEGSIVRRLIGLNRAPPGLPFPRVFLLFFFFSPFFLPILLLFSSSVFFFATDTNAMYRSCFFFSEHISTTHNEGWLRCSLWRKRGGKGIDWLSRGQSSSLDASPWKRDLSRRWGERVEGVSKILGWTRSGFLFSSKLGVGELYFIRSFNATIMK